jgi:hypothetical protein
MEIDQASLFIKAACGRHNSQVPQSFRPPHQPSSATLDYSMIGVDWSFRHLSRAINVNLLASIPKLRARFKDVNL